MASLLLRQPAPQAWLSLTSAPGCCRGAAHGRGRHSRAPAPAARGRGAPPPLRAFDVAGAAPVPPPSYAARPGGLSRAPHGSAPSQGPLLRAQPREVPGDAALAARLQAQEQQGGGAAPGFQGSWAASNGHASPAASSVGWDSKGEAVMPSWDANGHGDAGGAAGGWEGGDGWGGAWDSPSAARPDTSEDAALAAKLQVPDQIWRQAML